MRARPVIYRIPTRRPTLQSLLKCMRNDFSLLISLLQGEDKAQINVFQ